MNEAILICSEDWEGLFVSGELKEEGHTLNEGYDRAKYFAKLSKKYNFDIENFIVAATNEDGEDYLYDVGCYPKLLSKFEGMYEVESYEIDEE